MDRTQNNYWPFDVLPLDQQTELHRQEIAFLETAFREGYRPYVFGADNYGATGDPRSGEIIYRGCRGKHWEVMLAAAGRSSLSAHVDDFTCAGEGLLMWLRGAETATIFDFLKGHLATVGYHFQASSELRAGELACCDARKRSWKVSLRATDGSRLTAQVDDFSCAADALLLWLRGSNGAEVIEFLREYLRTTPDCPQGYTLHETVPVEVRTTA